MRRKLRKITSIYINPEIWNIAKKQAKEKKLTLCDYLETLIMRDYAIDRFAKIAVKEQGGLPVIPVQIVHKVERLRRGVSYGKLSTFSIKRCPNCGSDHLEHKPLRTQFGYNGRWYLCRKCGHYFPRTR